MDEGDERARLDAILRQRDDLRAFTDSSLRQLEAMYAEADEALARTDAGLDERLAAETHALADAIEKAEAEEEDGAVVVVSEMRVQLSHEERRAVGLKEVLRMRLERIEGFKHRLGELLQRASVLKATEDRRREVRRVEMEVVCAELERQHSVVVGSPEEK